jgi:hypothetical protein
MLLPTNKFVKTIFLVGRACPGPRLKQAHETAVKPR